MAKATGLGGTFLRTRDPEVLYKWYELHLGVPVDTDRQSFPYGRFGWFTDPEGNRVELWEP